MDRSSGRWWLVAFAALAMGAAGSYQFVWSTIRGPLGAHVGAGEAALGTVFTAFVLAQTVAGFPAGRYRDRHGPRLPLAVGGVLVAAGYAGVALAPSFPAALAAYALGGVGSGTVYTVAVNTPVKWFDARRGLATGVVTMAYSASSAPLIRYVGPTVGRDFAGTLAVLAAVTGVACLVGVPVLDDPERAADAGGDGRTGTETGGDGDGEADDDPGAERGGDEREAPAAGRASSGEYTWRETVRTWQFWTLYGAFLVVNGVGLMLIGKVVALATGLGLPAGAGTLAASVLAVGDGAGIVVIGAASDRLGRERTVGASLTCCGLALAGTVLLGAGSAGAFVALAGAAAFLRSPAFAVFPSLVGEYYGAERSSENYALLYSAKLPGGVVGGTAASLLVAAVGWTDAFLLGAGLLVVAGLATAALRPVQPTARTAESAT
ncbi:MAG: MFS transporter [Haloferacaceae archaeon]